MKLKKTLLAVSLLSLTACSDKDNSVKVDMTDCDGTECSFDASKSKIKSHSQVLEYDWEFHDNTDMEVTKKPQVKHDFNIHLGATLDGNNPDLDLREVTLNEVLTNHHIISKTFKFRTHQHDPKALFLAKKPEMLGLSDGSQLIDLDASESDAGQGDIKEYIWEIDGEKTITETPILNHNFSDKSSGNVKLTVINSFSVESTTEQNVLKDDVDDKYFKSKIQYKITEGSYGLNYDFNIDLGEYDKSKYKMMWVVNGNIIDYDVDSIKDILVDEGYNHIAAYMAMRDNERYIFAGKSLDLRAHHELDPAFTSEINLNTENTDDNLHYNFSVKTNDYNKERYKQVFELNGHKIDSLTNVPVKDGNNIIEIKIINTDNNTIFTTTSKEFFASNNPSFLGGFSVTPMGDNGYTSIKAVYRIRTSTLDTSKHHIIWEVDGIKANPEDIGYYQNISSLWVDVKEGVHQIKVKIADDNGNIISEKQDVFNAIFKPEINYIHTNDKNNLYYDFVVDTNNFDKSKYHTVFELNGNEITSLNNVLVQNGQNTIIAKIISQKGDVVSELQKTFYAEVMPEFIDITATPVSNGDGLHYSIDVKTNDYDKSKYYLYSTLNNKTLSNSFENVKLNDGKNVINLEIKNYSYEVLASKSITINAKALTAKATIDFSNVKTATSNIENNIEQGFIEIPVTTDLKIDDLEKQSDFLTKKIVPENSYLALGKTEIIRVSNNSFIAKIPFSVFFNNAPKNLANDTRSITIDGKKYELTDKELVKETFKPSNVYKSLNYNVSIGISGLRLAIVANDKINKLIDNTSNITSWKSAYGNVELNKKDGLDNEFTNPALSCGKAYLGTQYDKIRDNAYDKGDYQYIKISKKFENRGFTENYFVNINVGIYGSWGDIKCDSNNLNVSQGWK